MIEEDTMKHLHVSLYAIFILLIICYDVSRGQIYPRSYDQNKEIKNRIAPLIHGKYGAQYDFTYHVFDTVIQYSKKWNDGRIEDPYGTIKGCILFSVIIPSHYDKQNALGPPQDTNIVGMIRDGRIIWDNFPGEVKSGAGLLYAQDLNNDGEIDLVFSETDKTSLYLGRSGPFLSYLHILSWNGTRGRFISAEMEGCDRDYYPIDIDGDGIMEIRASLPPEVETYDEFQNGTYKFKTSTYPLVTYGWNGSQYGLWPNVRQIKMEEFLPANRMKVAIKCCVEKQIDKFNYSYTVTNDSTSKQKISQIYIGGLEDTTQAQAPLYWFSSSSRYIKCRLFILNPIHEEGLINPGTKRSGFYTLSPVLPNIVKYYVQGYNFIVAFGTDEQQRQDIYNNSVIGFTLGTRDTSIKIDSIAWCDTLASFTARSRDLGWIKQQPTSDKYTGYFSTAKTALQKNQISLTRSTLTQVLHDVDVDSSSTLTSEAYALIKYNTEYLLAHLPITISALDMLDTLRVRTDRTIPNNTPCSRDFKEDLLENIQKAKQELIEGDTIHCAMYIVAYEKQLEAKNNHRKGKPCVTDDEYNYLYPYAKSIVELLLQLPPKCGGSCKDKLIDLKAEVGKCAGKGYCSRGEFENGMEEQIGKAVKCIENKDSTGTATCLGLFEQEVQQTYEQTKKRYDERKYVKPEGYITLYYKAEYILEDLEH